MTALSDRIAPDLPRVARACEATLSAIRCTTDGDSATVAGGALRELRDALVSLDRDPLDRATVAAVQAELWRAIAKHGRENTPLDPSMSDGTFLAVLVEEVGEVARAMTYDEGDRDELVRELIQVAAMAAARAQALTQP